MYQTEPELRRQLAARPSRGRSQYGYKEKTSNENKEWKRIGPVPIAAVAVFALAALLSAGLLTLSPGSTQAQTAPGTIDDVTLDVNESPTTIMTLSSGDPAVASTFPVGASAFEIVSDQNDPDTDVDQTTDDDNGGIETEESGSNGRNDAIEINDTTGVITIPTAIASQENASQTDNTARISVTATVEGNEVTVRFDVTVVQDPSKTDGGDPLGNPARWDDAGAQSNSDCAVSTDDGTALTSRSIPLTDANPLVSGGDCTSSGTSVDVALQNSQADSAGNEVTYLAYVTGGDSFAKVDGFAGKAGLRQELHEVDHVDALGDPGEAIIAVSRSMADSKGQVYVYGFFDAVLSDKRIRTSSEAFTNQAADFIVLVQFVDGPALRV